MLIATPTQPLLGIFLGAFSFYEINSYVLIFLILYLISIIYACNINCYYDRDVDIKYKVNLAQAVDNIGKSNLKKILILESGLIFILSTVFIINGFLITINYLYVGIFSIIGWVMSTIYSAEPIRIKKRGIISPLPLIIGLFALPFISGWIIITLSFYLYGLIFLLGYIFLNEGLNLINTLEDYTEDFSSNIKTWGHIFGIKNSMYISIIFTIIGSIMCILALFIKLSMIQNYFYNVFFSYIFIFITLIFSIIAIIDLIRIINSKNILKSIKLNSKKLPIWFATTRYPMLFASICMLLKI